MGTSLYPLQQIWILHSLPIQIANGISIVNNDINIENYDTPNISEIDRVTIKDAKCCLSIDDSLFEPKEASYIFIAASRLLKHSQVWVKYHFKASHKISISIDNYNFLEVDDTTQTVTEDEVTNLCKLFSNLNRFSSISGRLRNALYFLSRAYLNYDRLESLLFLVFAMETIISAQQQELRSTDIFVNRIYNFTGFNQDDLRCIYNVRSEMVHGRYNPQNRDVSLNLLRIADSASRKTFLKLLLDDKNINAFANEATRMLLFSPSTP